MKKKPLIIASVIIATFIFIIITISSYKSNSSAQYNDISNPEIKPQQNEQDTIQKEVIKSADNTSKSTIKNNNKILKQIESDIFLGSQNAPITIIEYASLSCPHCAYFTRDAFPKLKSEYIDKGLVKFIFRDFPLNQPALVAGIIAKCHANKNSEKYYNFLKILFKSQDSWAFDKDFIKKLEVVAKMDGINKIEFDKCLERNDIQEEILKNRLIAAQELEIDSTPTFFINGNKIGGYTDYLRMKNIIETELKNINQNE